MFKLTTDQQQALNGIWDIIANDVIQSEDETLTKEEVIGWVLDADRPKTFYPHVDWSGFDTLTYTEKCVAAEEAFTYSLYGM